MEAVRKATELIEPMLRRALAAGVQAKYLPMDSWFGMPAIISKAREHLPVICMVKRTPKILYGFDGKRRTVEDIYRRLRKVSVRLEIPREIPHDLLGHLAGSARIVMEEDHGHVRRAASRHPHLGLGGIFPARLA